jgi:hypothetical protein
LIIIGDCRVEFFKAKVDISPRKKIGLPRFRIESDGIVAIRSRLDRFTRGTNKRTFA